MASDNSKSLALDNLYLLPQDVASTSKTAVDLQLFEMSNTELSC